MGAGKEMITKKLLTEVLGHIVTNVSLLRNKHINITGATEKYTPATVSIDIYELAYLCKKWSVDKKSICINSAVNKILVSNKPYQGAKYRYNGNASIVIDTKTVFTADSEPEAVFKAAQWILDNIA